MAFSPNKHRQPSKTPLRSAGNFAFVICGLILCASFKETLRIGNSSPLGWPAYIAMQLSHCQHHGLPLIPRGFLNSRPSNIFKLDISCFSGQKAEVELWHDSNVYFGDNNRVQPLDTRGWCLQESYLSRRQIKFLDDRILWSCKDANYDEMRGDGGVTMAGTGAANQTMNLYRGVTPRRHRTLTLLTPYQGWYRLVKDFTRRNLTFPSDVLPALSGLAVEVANHDNARYCAGVWWEDMAFGICWKKSSWLERAGKKHEYIAPSCHYPSTPF